MSSILKEIFTRYLDCYCHLTMKIPNIGLYPDIDILLNLKLFTLKQISVQLKSLLDISHLESYHHKIIQNLILEIGIEELEYFKNI